MAIQIQVRRDTAANWTSNDPTLAAGELGCETDTNKIKLGDGSTAWTALAYFGGGLQNVIEDTTPQLGGDLDAQTKRIYDVKVLDFKAPTELTIATGAITVTQTFHTVDTQADAATDDLATINGGSDGRLIVLKAINGARTVVIKHNTGNIWLQGKADISLDDISDGLMLVYSATDSKWFDIAAGGGGGGGLNNVVEDVTPQLGGDLDCQTKRLYDIKLLDLKTPTELTISSGTITITQSQHYVDTEGDASTDDLVTIYGGGSAYGRLLFIRPAADTRTIVVKHGTGNIQLKGGADLTLDELDKGLLLIYTTAGWLDVGAGGGGASTGWQLVDDHYFSTTATSYTISGLDGNSDHMYMLNVYLRKDSVDNSNILLRLNNDSGTNYPWQWMRAFNTTVDAQYNTSITGFIVARLHSGGTVGWSPGMFIYAATGARRPFFGYRHSDWQTSSSSPYMMMEWSHWTNTGSNITSFNFIAEAANLIGAGSRITVWRKAR